MNQILLRPYTVEVLLEKFFVAIQKHSSETVCALVDCSEANGRRLFTTIAFS